MDINPESVFVFISTELNRADEGLVWQESLNQI